MLRDGVLCVVWWLCCVVLCGGYGVWWCVVCCVLCGGYVVLCGGCVVLSGVVWCGVVLCCVSTFHTHTRTHPEMFPTQNNEMYH